MPSPATSTALSLATSPRPNCRIQTSWPDCARPPPALGTGALARADATTLGLIGGGKQARVHLLAFAAIRKLRLVKVYRRDAAQRAAFAAEMSELLKIEVHPVETARAAVADADIVLAATNSSVPVFEGDWLEPGQHVTSIVGSNVGLLRLARSNKRRELDDRTLARMDVISAASRDQAIADEQGDLFDPVQSGIITIDAVKDIGDILTGRVPGRTGANQLTLFKNNAGQGICDVTLVARVVEHARQLGRGMEIRRANDVLQERANRGSIAR